MPDASIFDPDPMDEQALLTQLGGAPVSPVESLDQNLKRARLKALTAQALKRAEAQAKEDFVGPIEPTPKPVTLKTGGLGQVPAQPPAPPMSVTLNQGELGQAPPQPPPGPEGRPTIDGYPEDQTPPRPKQIGAMDVVTTPMELPAAGVAGAYGAMLDQPAEAGVGTRLGAAMQGAGGAMHDRLTGGETPTMKTEAAKRGVDTGMVGTVGSAMVDPLNATGPLDLAQIVSHLPALAKGGVAMAHALPIMGTMAKDALAEGPIATARALGSGYGGAKALRSLDKATAQAFMAATKEYPAVRKAAQYLHPAEVARLTDPELVRQFDRFYAALPSADTLLGGIHGGAAKRGWYENSRRAVEQVYGDEADMFAGVLAATSPRNDVKTNFTNANKIFENWRKAGRPTDPVVIEQIMNASVPGKILPAWKNNTIRVLQEGKTLSGSKVDSFWTNLRSRPRVTTHGEMAPDQAVTLDAWMANLFGVHNESFSGGGTDAMIARGDPGHSPQYLAGSARMRAAAEKAGVSPAEAQETIWSFGKALYEQSSKGKLTARQIIEQGLLDPKRIEGVPDFATLYADAGHKGVTRPTTSHWKPDQSAKEEMLLLADELDRLRGRRNLGTAHKVGAEVEGKVMGQWPVEARPGQSGVFGDFPQQLTPKQLAEAQKKDKNPAEMLQNSQDAASSRLLSKFEDEKGRNVIGEALFPNKVPEVQGGRGDWMGPGGLEQNKLQTTPFEMRTRTGTGGAVELHPEDAKKARAGSDILSYLLGQDAGVTTALHFDKDVVGGKDAMRVYPKKTSESFPDDAFRAIRAKFPPGEFALQHRDNGLDIVKLTGPMTDAEAQQIETVARDAIYNNKIDPTGKRTVEKTSGAKMGTNIADANTQYRAHPEWRDQNRELAIGSRGMTEKVFGGASDYAALDQKTKKRLDSHYVRNLADDLVRELGTNSRADHLEALKIVAQGGVSALAKALGDPSKVLPMLAAIGLGGALGVSGDDDEQQQNDDSM